MPEVKNQRTRIFTAAEIERIIAGADAQCGTLYAPLAASGLPMVEALALRVTDFHDGTLTVCQSIWNGRITAPKTHFADREADLPVEFARLLAAFVGDRRDGYLFQNRNGGPMSQRNVLRRSLHPILKSMGWSAGALTGFHAFRRFRVTHLRKQRTHDDLLR